MSVALYVIMCLLAVQIDAFVPRVPRVIGFARVAPQSPSRPLIQAPARRLAPLRDLLGLGPAEIAISLVVALVLFGPETLKSLSKDMGKAAAELKEIPKTFKEGMEEGADSSQMSKMKAIAAAKRSKRDDGDAGDEGEAAAPGTRTFEG